MDIGTVLSEYFGQVIVGKITHTIRFQSLKTSFTSGLCFMQVSKNTQEPEWNYEAQVTIPDQGDKTITIEVSAVPGLCCKIATI
jgi:hypothetical protein